MSSRPSFFIDPRDIEQRFVHVRDADQVRQLRSVFRFGVGDAFTVLDGKGCAYDCTIDTEDKKSIRALITARRTIDTDPPFPITLALSLIRRERFATVLEKATELGVTTFQPIIAERSPYKTITPALHVRWEHIIREAAEIAPRGRLPTLAQPRSLAETFAHTEASRRIALALTDDAVALSTLVPSPHPASPRGGEGVTLFVGPEGDFTEGEYIFLRDHGVAFATLGTRVLRSDTAAIAAVSVLCALS